MNLSAYGELYFTLHELKDCQCEARYGGLCGDDFYRGIEIKYIYIKLGKSKKVWRGYKNMYIRWRKILSNRIVAILNAVEACPGVYLANGGR